MITKIKDAAIIILLILVGWQSCRKPSNTHTRERLISSDTVYQKEKPVVIEKHFHHSEPIRIVENWHTVQNIDTSTIIQDYFRARYYQDSLHNDTVSYTWSAKVSRNVLDSFSIKTRFTPITKVVTNKYEMNRSSVGVMAVYVNSTPYIGAFGTWQTKRFSLSGGISPMNTGAFILGVGVKVGK